MQVEHGDIFDSIQSGNIPGVKEFLDAGVPVNLTDEEGWSLLHHAAACDQVEVIRLLQENGCYIDAVDSNGRTALHYAAANGFVESARALIEMGSDVNALDNEHTTPLQWAVMSEQYAVMKALIEHGGSVDGDEAEPLIISVDLDPKTVSCHSEQAGLAVHNAPKNDISSLEDESQVQFFKAVQSGDTTAVTECLDLGVPVDLTDEDGWSPVHHAIAHGQVEVIRLLMDRGCRMVPAKNSSLLANEDILKDGDTEGGIFDAARSGNIAIVKGFLDLGIPADLTDEDGWSPVHHAIAHGQVEVIRLLMDRGCRMSSVKSRIPPSSDYAGVHNSRKCDIFDAARSGDTAKLKEYLELGVSVDVTDEDGCTPLHCAAGEGQFDAVKLLIEKGCCIDAVDHNGWTPTMYATMQGQDEVELLLNLAKSVCDSTGCTLLHAAAADGQLEVIEMLLSVGGRKLMTVVAGEAGTPLHQAAGHGHKDVVTLLLNEGCPIDIRESNGYTALHFAAQYGHIHIIETLINHGLDVNIVSNKGTTPLHSAAIHGQLESVQTLLRLGGRKSLTTTAKKAGTPLHRAAAEGHKDVVSLLLKEGCSINVPDGEGMSPVHVATMSGKVDIIEMLMRHDLDVRLRDGDGFTALHFAAQCGQVVIIELLVNHGLDVNAEDNEGCTPLHSAAAHGQLESIHTVLRLGGRKSLAKSGREVGTPLHQAIAGGHKDVITLLLKEGCPLTTRDCNGVSVLHAAAQFGQEELIAYLIDCGLDANIEDDDGRTPLHLAVFNDQLGSVRALLRLGGRRSMAMIARGAGTPLHFAVGQGNKDFVSLLLSEGCPMNTTITDGRTALHVAAETGQVDMIEMFVDHGLDVNIQEHGGITPLHVAACENQLESARTLIELGGRRSMTVMGDTIASPLHQAVAKGHKDMVSLLLKEGCPTNVTDGNGMSAVHAAAVFSKVDIIEVLVKHGLDVNLVDNKGCTPLHRAAIQGNLESVCTLVRSGGKASMTMVADHIGTPLHQAVGKGYNDIVTLLLDEGCDSPENGTTSEGITALHVAANAGRVDVVDMLLKRRFDANAVDMWGWTPQFFAVHHMKLMRRLILSGGRISHRDNFGVYFFEYSIAFECLSSHIMKLFVEASGIACDGSNFANVISTLSKNNLIDINRILCLAAVKGHVDLFDDIVDSDLPLDQQRMPKLVQALCIRKKPWKVIENLLDELHILDDPLNPLHLSLISCKQLGPGPQSTAQHKYAERVISHPRTKYTIYELFPNGLSPLDVARQFELHDIASMIERAGGRPGIWADLPKEMGQKSMEILRSLKRIRGSEFGEDCIRTLLMMCGYAIKEEEGRKAAQNAVLEQTPEQSDVEECILSSVKELRKWRRVGELLKVDAPVLDKLAKDADGSDDAYYSMLKYWLKHGHSVTRKTLLNAIGHFETKKTMDDIRKTMERGLSLTNVGRYVTC